MTSDSSQPTSSTIVLRVADIRHRFVNVTSSLHLDDAYVVTASTNGSTGLVDVVGQSPSGVFYGVQTLLAQLSGRRLVAGEVVDAPRFAYRGLMLDVARNFVAKDVIERTVDAMAAYKMNRLHLHLTDDQGWRLDVPALPELTAVGARRGHDAGTEGDGRRSMLPPYLGSGPSADDAATNGGAGFYSREDYRDILRHARRRHVTVIPEVDVPGHSAAAILSMRGRGRDNVTLVDDENDMFEYVGVNGYKNDLMNMCLKSSLSFIDHVITALVDLHKVCHSSVTRQLRDGHDSTRDSQHNVTHPTPTTTICINDKSVSEQCYCCILRYCATTKAV